MMIAIVIPLEKEESVSLFGITLRESREEETERVRK